MGTFFMDHIGFVLITYLIGLFCAAHAVMYIRTPQSAVAWALTLFFMPYVTLPFYLMFSHLRFAQFVKAHRRKLTMCDDLYKEIWSRLDSYYQDNGLHNPDDLVDTSLSGTGQFPMIAGHDITLLQNGRETYDAMHEKIRSAKKYICLSYFLVRHDREGRALRDLLIEKAEEGVDVYFLYDEQGCSNTYGSFWKGFQHEDIQLRPFNAINGPRTLLHYNFRNHRKVVIVDGLYAFTGGLNIGQDYCGEGEKFDHWRDTHIGFSGAAVLTLQKCFCRDWYWATGGILELDWPLPKIPTTKGEKKNQTLQVIPTYPEQHKNASLYVYLSIINAAKKRIWITSPYFIPVPEIYAALKHAVIRGVDVKIILPKNSDHFHTYFAGMTYIHAACRAGIEVYLYKRGFMHQKTMLIDDDNCGVGSLNMDYRSIQLNFEIMTLSRSKTFCTQMDKMLREDLKECIHVSGNYFRKQPFHIRLTAYFIRLFSPIL